ncbi:MAG: OmpA family protein [Saprospiraceae bacterium]|nr:OmpA family protein [Saprospiraceae bacterium]
MRNRIIYFLAIFTLFVNFAIAQNPEMKSGISFKKLFLDYQSQNGGEFSKFKDYKSGFEIGYHRNLNSNLNLVVPFKYGVVNSHNDSIRTIQKSIAGLDAQIQYMFNTSGSRIQPYVMAGAGGVMEFEGEFNVQIPVGLGLFFRVSPNTYFNFQSEYRYSLADNRNNLQHGLGFVYLFGRSEPKPELPVVEMKDSDNDGVVDELDLCPNEFGLRQFNGCPDKDDDGVPDYLDKCPDVKGLKEFAGCPDTDGDGIPDHEDECPKVAGIKALKGCPTPDRDGDGVPDDIDKCPDVAGLKENNGCPIADRDGDGVPDDVDKCPDKPGLKIYNGCPDTDGDGIDDSRDECPETPGTVANNGCPEMAVEDKKTLDVAMRAVQFQLGSAVLKPESNAVLRQIADIMRRYKDFSMTISGHTDNTGSSPANQLLSEKRAKACYDFLIKEGISSSRMSFAGYGESRPISTNENEKGRALNRRVEFNMIPR